MEGSCDSYPYEPWREVNNETKNKAYVLVYRMCFKLGIQCKGRRS